jgi:hypothetical protein
MPNSDSSNENNHDLNQTDPDIPSQAPKGSPIQKSNQEVNKPTKSYKLNSKESRENGRQQMNDLINNYAQTMLKLGKKFANRQKMSFWVLSFPRLKLIKLNGYGKGV